MAQFDATQWLASVRVVTAAASTPIFGSAAERRLRVRVDGSGAVITDFGTVGANANKMYRFVRWSGVNTIVNGARIITQTGDDIDTEANDISLINGDTSGGSRVYHFRGSGKPLVKLDGNDIKGSADLDVRSVTDDVGRLQAMPRSTTAALAAIGNAINTTDKFTGKVVINTTAGTIVTAAGGTAADVWQSLSGSTAHTPV